MKKIIILSMIALMSLGMSSQLFAQSLNLYNIDPSAYPTVRVTYSVEDANGEEVRTGIDESKITVTETGTSSTIGIDREKLDPFCAPSQTKAFSAVLVIDLSQSMKHGVTGTGEDGDPYTGKSRFEVARNAIIQWIQQMNPYSSEVAIVGFAAQAYVIHEYSNDQASLLEAINKVNLNDVLGEVGNGTNYNAGLLWQTDMETQEKYFDEKGALHFCKPEVAKYTPAIVFMTDGNHQADVKRTWNKESPIKLVGEVLKNEINTTAKARGAHIFMIQIGGELLNGPSISTLNYLASISGSPSTNLKLRIDNEEQLYEAYNDIYKEVAKVAQPPKCYFDFITDCDGGGTLVVDMTVDGIGELSDTTEYVIPDELKPEMRISDYNIVIKDDNPAVEDKIDFTIEARKNDIVIQSFDISDNRYSVDPTSLKIEVGTPETFTLRYNSVAEDSTMNEVVITAISNACSGNVMNPEWEMIPYLEDVNMGNVAVDVTSPPKTIELLFVNKTHETIDIASLDIDGADKTYFVKTSPVASSLKSGEVLVVDFEFTPDANRYFEADLILTTDDGDTYESIIFGDGNGAANITHDALTIPNTTCANPTATVNVIVNNTGPVEMNITDAKIISEGAINGFTEVDEFKLQEPFPDKIQANSSETFVVEFAPNDQRLKDAILQITSDADNAANYDIQLEARQDSIDFGFSQTTIDLGHVCMGSDVETDIDISALTGVSADFVVDCTPAQANISIDNNSWSLTSEGTTQAMKVTFTGDGAGDFSEVITFTDANCGREHTITFTGTAANPTVESTTIEIASTVMVQKDYIETLHNTSNAAFTITNMTSNDTQFVITNSFPETIAPNGDLDIYFEYTPTDGVDDPAILTIETEFCGPITVPLLGRPAQATADLFIDRTYTGVAGTSISIPIDLLNPQQFVESGTESIDVVLEYDITMLNITNVDAIETVTGAEITIPITPQNVDMPTIYTLEFNILSTSVDLDTEIEFVSAESDKANVVFNGLDGSFALNPSTATLSLDDIVAEPGQVVNIPIIMSDVTNVSRESNSSIAITMRYKASILDPIDPAITPAMMTIDGDDRVIKLPAILIPIDVPTEAFVLKSFKFKAMLGMFKASDIMLEDPTVETGAANFVIDNAVMTLKICESGGEHLFDPNGSAILTLPVPNPASGMTEIMFETAEKAATEVYICDLLGNKVRVLYQDIPEKSEHTLKFDASDLNSGMYFIIMKTPTQTISKKFRVVK